MLKYYFSIVYKNKFLIQKQYNGAFSVFHFILSFVWPSVKNVQWFCPHAIRLLLNNIPWTWVSRQKWTWFYISYWVFEFLLLGNVSIYFSFCFCYVFLFIKWKIIYSNMHIAIYSWHMWHDRGMCKKHKIKMLKRQPHRFNKSSR